jgi:hypothetical protein
MAIIFSLDYYPLVGIPVVPFACYASCSLLREVLEILMSRPEGTLWFQQSCRPALNATFD